MKIAGKILRLAVSLFALAATTVSAVVFTNNTAISPLDLTYDGADITVSNCTVTVDGPHAFASLQVLTGGVVTHSFSANGSITGWINVTDEPQVLSATNPATLLNGNIDAVSYPLTVTDTNHTVVYSNTVDYMLTSLGGGVMQLQLTTNSAIAEGATVFVDYTYLGMISAAGLNLSVTGDVTVAPGGSINANGIGYGGPQGAGAGHHANGSFYDGSGAGYGGNGGSSSSNAVGGFCYGSYSQPANLGSGGGASYAGNGGNGGGSIKIIAGGNIFVDGIISANGADATNTRAGGGSGGSIWIVTGNTNVFAGAGSITANGGAGEPVHGGGGGGGRISLQCFSNNFAGAMAAYGGNGAKIGGAGTIYTKINSNTKQILVDNGGRAGTNTTLAVADNSDVVIRGRAGVMPLGSWTVGNLTIGSNSLLQAFSQIALALTVNGNLTIQPGGSLNADTAGSIGNTGTGVGHIAIIANYYPCGGGGFGGFGASGLGFNGAGGSTYGSQGFYQSIFGSGGGSYSTFSFGGAGGGNIQLSVIGTLEVDGTISANGGSGIGTGGGGGSGGMVWLSSGILAGSGNIFCERRHRRGSGGRRRRRRTHRHCPVLESVCRKYFRVRRRRRELGRRGDSLFADRHSGRRHDLPGYSGQRRTHRHQHDCANALFWKFDRPQRCDWHAVVFNFPEFFQPPHRLERLAVALSGRLHLLSSEPHRLRQRDDSTGRRHHGRRHRLSGRFRTGRGNGLYQRLSRQRRRPRRPRRQFHHQRHHFTGRKHL
jgi:hypothetical protein